jgi:hypothetical protein
MINTMTSGQQAFVEGMLAEIFEGQPEGVAAAVLARNIDRGLFENRGATKNSIDKLIAKRDDVRRERRAATFGAAVLAVEAGYVYYSARGIVRVVMGKTSGKPYAEKLNTETKKFEYAAGEIFRLQSDATARKMTLEEAKRESVLFGQCMRCSAKLKPAKDGSQRFIGPVCVKYFS